MIFGMIFVVGIFNTLRHSVPKFAGSNPVEAVGFFG
jgi:hypothetical protein